MKKSIAILSLIGVSVSASAEFYTPQNGETLVYEYGEPVALQGDVSVHYQSSSIKAWATGYKDYNVGKAVDSQ